MDSNLWFVKVHRPKEQCASSPSAILYQPMKHQAHNLPKHRPMEMITKALRGIIRWVRLLGSPRSLQPPSPEAAWIANARKDALRQGITPPIIVRYTFRVRLCPTTDESFSSKTRN